MTESEFEDSDYWNKPWHGSRSYQRLLKYRPELATKPLHGLLQGRHCAYEAADESHTYDDNRHWACYEVDKYTYGFMPRQAVDDKTRWYDYCYFNQNKCHEIAPRGWFRALLESTSAGRHSLLLEGIGRLWNERIGREDHPTRVWCNMYSRSEMWRPSCLRTLLKYRPDLANNPFLCLMHTCATAAADHEEYDPEAESNRCDLYEHEKYTAGFMPIQENANVNDETSWYYYYYYSDVRIAYRDGWEGPGWDLCSRESTSKARERDAREAEEVNMMERAYQERKRQRDES
jgi:hypothetical protein